MKYYISDLHFGHANVIKFDHRPFENIEEMEEKLINNINNTVKKPDTLYILGDFCWLKADEWIRILNKIRCKNIVLIRGNHDIKEMPSELKNKFQGVYDYKEIDDMGRKVIMCHYPIPFYKSDYNPDIYMLYGHLHITVEEDFMKKIKTMILEEDNRGNSKALCQFYNVGCMMPWIDYVPRTLDEIIERHK